VLCSEQVGAVGAAAVGGIPEHFKPRGFTRQQCRRRLGVAHIARGQIAGGDQAGFRFHGDMGFEAVAVVVGGLVHVA
jgi:hypothetical protein